MPLPDPPLPADFQFSQNNLQDFLICQRRFQLRHILRLAWPAVQSEPVIEQEKAMQRGMRFHQMAQQSFLGLPAEVITSQISDPELDLWWQAFTGHPIAGLPGQRRPEFTLSAPLGDYRMLAKFDLLAFDPGQRFWIVDWKTNRVRPRRAWLAERVQTRLYRCLLAAAGAQLNGGQPIQPEQIQMLYWFTCEPASPEIFDFDTQTDQTDTAWLLELATYIARLAASGQPFPLTADEIKCAFCNYRSLCARGSRAATPPEEADLEPEDTLNLDFEQIAEIAF